MSNIEEVVKRFQDDYGPCHPLCEKPHECDACADRAVRFFKEVLDIEPDEWQYQLIRAYGRGERQISVKACHGPGKTKIAAGCAWHTLICRFPQHSVVTAPTKGQLFGAFMKEMRIIYETLPSALKAAYEVTNEKITKIGAEAECLFEARTAREEKPEALQGVHQDLGWVLLIVDEASGVHEKIFEAGVGSMSGENCQTILLSNPTRTSGFFYNTHMKPGVREEWCRISVGAHQSPRVSEKFIRDVISQWGRDSNQYRVRVQGEFPRSDADTVIPIELVDAAVERDIVMPKGLSEVWGLDVARFGDDDTVLVRRNRLGVLPDIQIWHGLDLMQIAGRVKRLYDEAAVKPDLILVDEIGLGAGVLDRLREQDLPARGVNVAEAASQDEKYSRLRSELWFRGREWLAAKNRSLPSCKNGCAKECPHQRLREELVIPTFKEMSNGTLLVESKANMKKRGYKSPNVADAFLLTLAAEPASLMHGSGERNGFNYNWNRPIERRLGTRLC